MGLTRDEALSIPFSMLLDLISIQQIKEEGAKRKRSQEDEEQELMYLLSYK